MFRSLQNWFRRPESRTTEREFADGDFDLDDTGDKGTDVSPRGWLTIDAVWQAVDIISGDLSKYPIKPHTGDKSDPESWEVLDDHPLTELLAVEPRRGIDSVKFWRRFWVSALLWNNAYILARRTRRGRLVAMRELDPAYVEQNVDGTYHIQAGNVAASSMIHVEGLALPGEISAGVFQRLDKFRTLENSVKLTQLTENYMRVWFERGGHNAGVLTVPPSMQEPTRRKVESQFSGKRKTWFKTVVLREGNWHQTGGSFKDQEITALRDQQVASVARCFNLAPSRLGLADNVSYSSQVEEAKEYQLQTIEPWERALLSELEYKLLDDRERGDVFLAYDKPKQPEAEEQPEPEAEADPATNDDPDQPRPGTTESETVESGANDDN